MMCRRWTFVVISFFLSSISCSEDHHTSHHQFHEMNTNIAEEGKKQYDLAVTNSQMPKYGGCWKEALSDLKEGCKHLSEDLQSRLALAFAKCFLVASGGDPKLCLNFSTVQECLRQMGDREFQAYTHFFIHTQNMCFFLMSQIWHEETTSTISRLSSTSAKVSVQLEEARRLQAELLQRQHQLINDSSAFSTALEASRETMRRAFHEFGEQRSVLFEVFERISELQTIVIGEFSWLYTIIFYVTAVLVTYVVTSTKRTRDARFLLVLILTANVALERSPFWIPFLDINYPSSPNNVSDTVFDWLWFCRKITIVLAVIVLLFTAYRFKDINKINNQLLQKICSQNEILENYVRSVSSVRSVDSIDCAQESDSDTSDSSDLSGSSDHTFIYPSSDNESFSTALELKNSTPLGVFYSPPSVTPSRYNLRSRQISANVTQSSSDVTMESDQEFGRIIKSLARQSYHNSKIVRSTTRPYL